MLAGKVAGLGFEIITKLESFFLMTVMYLKSDAMLLTRKNAHNINNYLLKCASLWLKGTAKRPDW